MTPIDPSVQRAPAGPPAATVASPAPSATPPAPEEETPLATASTGSPSDDASLTGDTPIGTVQLSTLPSGAAPPGATPIDPAGAAPVTVPLPGAAPLVSRLAVGSPSAAAARPTMSAPEAGRDRPDVADAGPGPDHGPAIEPELGVWHELRAEHVVPLLGSRPAPVTMTAPTERSAAGDPAPVPIRWHESAPPPSHDAGPVSPASGPAAPGTVQRSTPSAANRSVGDDAMRLRPATAASGRDLVGPGHVERTVDAVQRVGVPTSSAPGSPTPIALPLNTPSAPVAPGAPSSAPVAQLSPAAPSTSWRQSIARTGFVPSVQAASPVYPASPVHAAAASTPSGQAALRSGPSLLVGRRAAGRAVAAAG